MSRNLIQFRVGSVDRPKSDHVDVFYRRVLIDPLKISAVEEYNDRKVRITVDGNSLIVDCTFDILFEKLSVECDVCVLDGVKEKEDVKK